MHGRSARDLRLHQESLEHRQEWWTERRAEALANQEQDEAVALHRALEASVSDDQMPVATVEEMAVEQALRLSRAESDAAAETLLRL